MVSLHRLTEALEALMGRGGAGGEASKPRAGFEARLRTLAVAFGHEVPGDAECWDLGANKELASCPFLWPEAWRRTSLTTTEVLFSRTYADNVLKCVSTGAPELLGDLAFAEELHTGMMDFYGVVNALRSSATIEVDPRASGVAARASWKMYVRLQERLLAASSLDDEVQARVLREMHMKMQLGGAVAGAATRHQAEVDRRRSHVVSAGKRRPRGGGRGAAAGGRGGIGRGAGPGATNPTAGGRGGQQ